ncbi:MAG: alpha/beta hydrolase [Pseudomonadota bacterium]
MSPEPLAVPPSATLRLPDGRRLGYADYGDPGGVPVLVFHGLPGSRYQRHPDLGLAARLGARIVAPERPGFGLSDSLPSRRLTDWAGDVAALVDALGFERFAVAGVSAGGPYALACAAWLAKRVAGAAVVSGVGPPGSMPGAMPMAWTVRAAFRLAPRFPWLLRAPLGAAAALGRAQPGRYLDLLASHLHPVDREVLARPPVRAMFAQDLAEGLRRGAGPFLQDLGLLAADWGFDPATIEVPVELWHGDADLMIPLSAALALERRLKRPRLERVCGGGHFLVIDRWPEILGRLIAALSTS